MHPEGNYFFIINPVSGKGKGKKIIPMIEKYFNKHQIPFEIQVTSYAGEAKSIASKAIADGFKTIVAVGGDGTVNEIGSVIAGTETRFGIIPIGSGNGLARENNIPLGTKAAIINLYRGNIRKIDTGTCNGHFFACTAGIGFDADMAHAFLTIENRGLMGYVRTFLKQFFGYKTKTYQFKSADSIIEKEAFLITIANCRQWGNEFYISPLSKPNDGILEICILRKFPLILFPVLLYRIINKTIHKSKYFDIIRSSSITIQSAEKSLFHTDGEVSAPHSELEILIFTDNLSIISE